MAAQIVDATFVSSHIGTMPIIDTRDPDEYELGHIPTAINIPFNSLVNLPDGQSEALVRAFRLQTFSEECPMILYCQTGRRAKVVCDILEAHGYRDLYLYSGSYLDWISDPSRPVEL